MGAGEGLSPPDGAALGDGLSGSGVETTGASVGNSTTLDGWTAGVGVEWAFADQWSAKLEYDYIGLNNWSPSTSNIFVNDFLTLNGHVQEFKVGVNYRFGWGGGY